MDISLAIGFSLIAAAAVWNWYSLYLLDKRITAIIKDLEDIDQDLTYNIHDIDSKIKDLNATVNWHTLAVKDLADVREAARLKRQNETLTGLADSAGAYKKQIAANNKVIKELMP